ncbi:hypothetical protein AQUCO_00201217v1 [Aquilegia coerulea]|uniref:Uncharacterized protein n=1 Tax=Aquilegia coerulea TaxID=218851 RepID=A0A2G5F6Q8_AQUCA|nr:hypothetical protein AQUCO_00201217v1 [Aquilegia coerulea]
MIKKEKKEMRSCSREKRVWAVVMYNYGKAKVESGGGGDVREVREKKKCWIIINQRKMLIKHTDHCLFKIFFAIKI